MLLVEALSIVASWPHRAKLTQLRLQLCTKFTTVSLLAQVNQCKSLHASRAIHASSSVTQQKEMTKRSRPVFCAKSSEC